MYPRRLAFLLVLLGVPLMALAQPRQTQNVFLITLDGLRWQELFTGLDAALAWNEAYVGAPDVLVSQYGAATPEERREKLMPFFWRVLAAEGQLLGHRTQGAHAEATNRHLFSYPGYNEILTGHADDDRIDSNAKRPNPNVTVLEAANQTPGLAGRVAAFGSWDVFPYIVNEGRSGVPVNAGFEAAAGDDLTERERFLNELQPQIPSPWTTVRFDAFTHHYALEYLKKYTPRLVYIAYGETDDFAHDEQYDAYLNSAHQTDAFIAELWEWAQSHPAYRDQTTLVITTDHGRGAGDAWSGHGADVDGAEAIWIALLGPDTPALGVVEGGPTVYQNQVAATVAALLGFAYRPAHPVGPVLPTAFR